MMIEETGDFDPIYGYVLPSLPPSLPPSFVCFLFSSSLPPSLPSSSLHVVASKRGEK